MRHIHLTEHEYEHYVTSTIRGPIRGELLAQRRGEAPDRAAFEDAVTAFRQASEQRAAAACQANAEAMRIENAAREAAKPVLRCPKCKSTDVAYDPWFDHYKWVCKGCGHSELFENYPDPGDDSEWWE